MVNIKIYKGGPTSGNHGHSGRPGKVGGSAPDNNGNLPPTKLSGGTAPTITKVQTGIPQIATYTMDQWKAKALTDSGLMDRIMDNGAFDDKGTYRILNTVLKPAPTIHLMDTSLYPKDDPFAGLPVDFERYGLDDPQSDVAEAHMTMASNAQVIVVQYDKNTHEYFVLANNVANADKEHILSRDEALSYAVKIYNEDVTGATQVWKDASFKTREIAKDQLVTAVSEKSGIDYETTNTVIAQWAHSSNGDDNRSLSLQEAATEVFDTRLSDWQAKQVSDISDKAAKVNAETARTASFYDEATKFENDEISRLENLPNYVPLSQAKANASRKWRETYPDRPDLNDILNSGDYDIPDELTSIADRPTEKAVLTAMYQVTQDQLAKLGYKPDDTIRLFRGTAESAGKITIRDIGSKVHYQGNAMESWSVSARVAAGFGDYMLAMDVPIKNIISTSRTGFGCLPEGEIVVMGNYNSEALVIYSNLK